MNNPFDYTPSRACNDAFTRLLGHIEELKSGASSIGSNIVRELESGKMLGVLIAVDKSGGQHTLYAFSGQLGPNGFYCGDFVPPVFDYLHPDGYFKTEEAKISQQSLEIARFEQTVLADAKQDFDVAKSNLDSMVSEYKVQCRLSKLKRDARRAGGNVSDSELADMIRQSQFEKAQLRRLKSSVATELEPLRVQLELARERLAVLKEKRRSDSEALQRWLFSNFKVLNGRGEEKSLLEIFADTPAKVPPSGAGECCAPKLLQAAYRQGWEPVEMAEYWYGKPREGEIRVHGQYYMACRGKCRPVLGWMLAGLEIEPPLGSEFCRVQHCEPSIIFENRWFCVVDKPSGMLSVPGKGADISVEQWLNDRYGNDRPVKMVHRLDQDTSGLIIAAFDEHVYKLMQSLFAARRVDKTYVAVLDGDYEKRGVPASGRIELPLSPDWLDRPRQRVDVEDGKEAVTEYEFIDSHVGGHSRVVFHPLTGRTHQLRLHAASEQGLGMPIIGDRLYGRNVKRSAERLYLHAASISFTFPLDGRNYRFDSQPPADFCCNAE